jgi:hypothetical protein
MILHDVSAAAARTHWARGLTTDLIVQAAEQEPKVDIIAAALTAKSGRSLVALQRAAKRIARHPGCAAARATKQDRTRALEVVIRGARRDSELRYADQQDGFRQDLVRYILRQIRAKETEDSIVVLTRHTLQRWIERGGAGDPRQFLLQKLDRSIVYALQDADLIAATSAILAANLHDQRAQSARFGVPDERGGLWIAGLSGFATQSPHVKYRSLLTFLTYLSQDMMSGAQIAYRNRAVDQGLFAAARDFPDLFRPRATRDVP